MNQVVGVSMDTTNSIFDWLDSNPDLKEFDVPLLSDRYTSFSSLLPFLLSEIRDAEVSRAFGVLQRGYSDGQVGLRQFGVGWFSDHTTPDDEWLPGQLCVHRGQRGQGAPPHRP